MNPQDIAKLARAITDKAAAEATNPQLLPGSISAVANDGSVAVTIDGDDAANAATQAQWLLGDLPATGMRVMVLFQPPRACFVVGLVQQALGPIMLTKAGVPVDGDFPFTARDGMMAVNSSLSRVYVRVGGVWKYAALT